MSKIDVKIKKVKAANKELISLSSRVEGVENRISSIKGQIDSRIASRKNIGRNLSEAAAKAREAEKKLRKLHQFVDASMDLYVKADQKTDRLKEPGKKSIWDSLKSAFGTAADVVGGFRKGLAEAVISTVEGIWNAVTHPIETAKGIVYAVSHPVETAKSIWKSISDSWKNDVINGDAKSRSQWFGRAVGEVALAIIGTKGVDKAVKMAKGAKVVKEDGGVRVFKPETVEKKDPGIPFEKRVTPEARGSGDGVEKREVPQRIDSKEVIGDNVVKETGKSENISPSEIARSWQGQGAYPGIDKYRDITLKKGTIIYRGEPYGSEYFTTGRSIQRARNDATVLFEGLQVQRHPQFGYRPGMTAYVVDDDIAAAFGITKANPQYGPGNLPQMFVPDANVLIEQGILKPLHSQRLTNFK